MAEALLIHQLKETHPEVVVTSAGLEAKMDQPADQIAQDLMMQRGIDISAHRAQPISALDLTDIDLILPMTTRQQEQIVSKFPSLFSKVHRLGKWDEYDIPDPYRRPRGAFEQCLVLVEQGITSWCQRLWN
jgi:protein-tyrosine phosphatase